MKRIFPIMTALVPVLWLSTVSALGLGEIDVRSRLNQRFVASIPLSALGADEAETVRVALASNAEFDRAGIERGDYLSSLTFTVVNDGNPRIEVSSSQVVREPFLNFLLNVSASSGRLLREYTVLLDPPGVGITPEPVRPIPAPVSNSSEFYETAEEAKRPAAPAPKPAPAPVLTPVPAASPATSSVAPSIEPKAEVALGEGEYGPVQAGETFWSIASRLRPEAGVTMDQMLLAIYENNRGSFDGGINGLRRGAMLKVPSPDSIRAVSPAAAKAEVARLRGLPVQRSAAPSPAEPKVSAPAVEPAPAPAPAPITVKPIATPAQVPAAPSAAEEAPASNADAAAEAPISESSQPPPSDLGTPSAEAYASPSVDADTAVDGDSTASGDGDTAETAATGIAPEVAPVAVPEPEPAVASGGDSEPSLLEALLLPLLGGLLVLGGIGYLVSRVMAKRRSASPAIASTTVTRPKAATAAAPGAAVVAKPAAAAAASGIATTERTLSTKEQLEQIQDSFAETKEASASSSGSKTESFDTQQIKTQQIAADALDSAAATQMFEAPPAASPPTEAVDFDLTGQFESQTVQINLDANDPLSEADFHLAYGLYDEAALLLKQAAAKEPGRSDVQVKLAETYFAAGKVAEFRETAESLQPKLSAADWQKLAIMGQQLEPGAEIYQTDAGSADVDMDMSFDDLAAPPTATPPPSTAVEKAPAELPPLPTGLDEGLDFKLEDLELSTLDQDDGLELAKGKENALEFDLGDFDTQKPAAEATPAAPTAPAGNEMEFDLGQFDEPAMSEPVAEATPEAPAIEPAAAPQPESELEDVGDDFDFGEMPADSSTISGDEAGTKLDLARAYVDMGDDDMARSLLSEVMEQGSDTQKQDAQALIARLG